MARTVASEQRPVKLVPTRPHGVDRGDTSFRGSTAHAIDDALPDCMWSVSKQVQAVPGLPPMALGVSDLSFRNVDE